MKIRIGFVSNSSSSSFVCDLTGHTESGYDINLVDAEMVQCVNGHEFCYNGFPEVKKWANSDEDDESYPETERNGDYGYGLPERLCPICNGNALAKSMIVKRIKCDMARLGITADDVK